MNPEQHSRRRVFKHTPIDGYPTPTSKTQQDTENLLLEYGLTTDAPGLQRNAHLQFLAKNMIQGFPSRYVSQDASQPWLLFWTLQSFSILQVGLDPGNRQRAIDKILAWQHPKGGFSGGPGQSPHLLPTYAAVCAMAIVGRPGPGGGWDQIDRSKIYEFFISLKQPDGSFCVAEHMEVDVRGIYCLLVTAFLLNIVTPDLVKGTATFLASCQTYEGGFSSASHPFYSIKTDQVLRAPKPNLGEAHGGYTFCALASWILLQSYLNLETPRNISYASNDPAKSYGQWDMELGTERPQINLKRLTRWLANMQGSEVELGGFRGRTNKLVDGCYSWWCGGAFPLLEALGVGGLQNMTSKNIEMDEVVDPSPEIEASEGEEDKEWCDIDESLFDRKALQEYILLAGQHPSGGLRDKPPKSADAYHTLYCLSGLSAAQHHIYPSPARKAEALTMWKDDDSPHNALRKAIFTDVVSWTEEEGTAKVIGPSATNRLNATHSLTNLTVTHTEGIMKHFYKQETPPRPCLKPSAAKKEAK